MLKGSIKVVNVPFFSKLARTKSLLCPESTKLQRQTKVCIESTPTNEQHVGAQRKSREEAERREEEGRLRNFGSTALHSYYTKIPAPAIVLCTLYTAVYIILDG